MDRELIVGIIIFLIALSSLPISYITFNTQLNIGIEDIPWGRWIKKLISQNITGKLIDNITISNQEYPPDTRIILSIDAHNAVIHIRQSNQTETILNIRIYSTQGTIAQGVGEANYKYTSNYDEAKHILTILFKINNYLLTVDANPHNLQYLTLNNENGIINIELTSLENASLFISATNIFLKTILRYDNVGNASWDINIANGFGNIEIITPNKINPDTEGRVTNGFLSIDIYGDIETQTSGTFNKPGEKNKLNISIENGELSVKIDQRQTP